MISRLTHEEAEMAPVENEDAGRFKEIPVEDFGSGVVKLLAGAASGVLAGKGTGCNFCAAVGRDLGGVLRKVEAGLAGLAGLMAGK
jgi:hypothetical protein